jgi:hypothetical protein
VGTSVSTPSLPSQDSGIWDYLGSHDVWSPTPTQQLQIEIGAAVIGGPVAAKVTDIGLGYYGDAADAANTLNDAFHGANTSVIAQDVINDGFDVLNTVASPVTDLIPVPGLSAGLAESEQIGTAKAEDVISSVIYTLFYTPK